MKRIISITLSVVLFSIILFSVTANAMVPDSSSQISILTTGRSTDSSFDGPTLLDGIGTASIKQVISINGIEYPMYCTFDSPETALTNISKEASSIISLLKEVYKLGDFSSETVSEYYVASLAMLDDDQRPNWYSEGYYEFRRFRAFYDIYENEEKNNLLSNSIKSTYANNANFELDLDFLMLLPYDSYVNAAENNDISLRPLTEKITIVNWFDTSLGIEYAKKYATSPNKKDYDYFKHGDCANFASQILENGGIDQEVYDSVYSGWWHKKSKNFLGITTHKQSHSWTLADTFARYMGVSAITTDNNEFSKNIVAGDFIAADFDDDGDWDHIGFVTDRKGYLSSDGYYDYQVAQHTSNYLEWTSKEDNHWEITGEDGGRYARVRRAS